MTKIAIIIGSTRPGRKGEEVGKWIYEEAKKRSDVSVELVDLLDYNLPLLDEANVPAMGQYEKEHTKKWAAKIGSFDGYIFVTPEYNHGTSAALKNAIDYLFKEWTNKSCGFVGYGWTGGLRGIEQLRSCVSNLELADVRQQLDISFVHDYKDGALTPGDHKVKGLNGVIDQVKSWADALKPLRETQAKAA